MKKKVIAETAFHHQGEEGFMLQLVDELSVSRADCIKLHLLLDIDEYMHRDHPLYETLKKFMLPVNAWKRIFETIKDAGKELIVLCNDRESVDFALENGGQGLELHAATTPDPYLFEHIVNRAKGNEVKTFVGVGALSLEEVDTIYQKNINLVLMFGIQNFPTKPEHIALARQKRLVQIFPRAEFGYADHSEWNHPDNLLLTLIGGLDKGYIEKHVSIRPGERRIDYESAISIAQLNKLRGWLDIVEQAEGGGDLVKNTGEAKYGQIGPMRKAMITKKNFEAGEELKINEAEVKFQRTSQVTDLLAVMLDNPAGYRFKHHVKAGTAISREFLEEKERILS